MLWFAGWLLAVVVLFRGALQWLNRASQLRSKFIRFVALSILWVGAFAVAILANMALTRHDSHFDFTVHQVFTPDVTALEVVRKLTLPVRLTYFFREDDPEGRQAERIVELMGKENTLLEVHTIDPDKHPSVAQTAGVKFYNAALLEAQGRQIVVRSTDENEIALGIQKVLREHVVTVCFMSGHGEYPSDNYEFHTHVEEVGGEAADHNHGAASAVVRTTKHGVGRFKRSLEALGYDTKVVTPATDGAIDSSCNVLVDAGPQTQYSDIETRALQRYLRAGGAALLLYDLEFVVEGRLRDLLVSVGIAVSDRVVVDDKQHYAADPENVAVTHYEKHPSTSRLSFTFFPGVRALATTKSTKHVSATPLFSSSDSSVGHSINRMAHESDGHTHEGAHHHDADFEPVIGSQILAVASEGKLQGDSTEPFKLIVVGDSDFVSNSFFPYMSNNRLALAMLRWLAGEADNVPLTARIPAAAPIEITAPHQRIIFLVLVIGLPTLLALLGLIVWWKRR